MLLIGLLPHAALLSAALPSGAESGAGEVGCCAWPDHKYKLRHNLDTKQTVKSGRQRGASASASNTKNNKNGVSWPLAQARGPRPIKATTAMASPEAAAHCLQVGAALPLPPSPSLFL